MRRNPDLRPGRQSEIRNPKSTAGYTLIEILLAVSVLMVVTAIGWQPVMRMYRDYRVKAAAEEVRSVLAGTRFQALDNDVVYQFLYEPSGRKYLRIPYESSSSPTTSTVAGSNQSSPGQIGGELPLGMTFQTVRGSSGGTLTPETLAGLQGMGDYSQVSWSSPVLFYSDGTATSAVFDIIDEQLGESRRVSVRDLTGGVTVSGLNDTSS